MAFRILYDALLTLSWWIALNWVWRMAFALRNLPRVPNLLDSRYDLARSNAVSQSASPSVCVIVPACNEEGSIGATLQSLLAAEGIDLEIIAVDDRSTDATGQIMDSVAATGSQKRLRVLHIAELPDGWLGKPHAMALAARQTNAEWLLFTDGDVLFRKDVLRRAMDFATEEQADHLVLYPTLILKGFGERVMISCFYVLSIWIARAWKIPDPRAKRDSIGVGAFSMVRREVYAAVGGYESLRMEVLEDVRMGFKIKRAGYRQRVAFGRDLVRIHWAAGAGGVVRNMTKNAFAAFGYRVWLVLAACFGLAMLSLLTLATAFFAQSLKAATAGGQLHRSAWQWMPAMVQFTMLWLIARYYKRHTGISSGYVLTFPLGICCFLFAIVRSMAITLRQRGVIWRGTLYPLAELRKHAGPVR